MASSEEELKLLLVEVGSKLEEPPTSVKELLPLLDRVEVYLSRVEQSPSKTIQNVLGPTLKALVGEKLLRHADVDVKVSVASCICEITRITAPEVPYDDDQMKEVFQLIVSSFESLADESSKSYIKRTSILEIVAKVRSCVVMLDLECEGLILEMFRHLIKAIRDYHPENVFTCMESIMTCVIEESEEISSDLLFYILDTVKKDNKEVTPTARKLMLKVIKTCADKLKPYIEIATRNKVVSLADYDELVSLICNRASAETVIQSEPANTSVGDVPTESNKPVQPAVDTIQTTEVTTAEAPNSIGKPPADGHSDLVTSNGNADVEADKISGSSTPQEPQSSNVDKASETVTAGLSVPVSNSDGLGVEAGTKGSGTINENPQAKDGDLDVEKVNEGESSMEPKAEKIINKRGRKTKAKKKTSEPELAGKSSNDVKQPDEVAELTESLKSSNKDKCPTPQRESSTEVAGHSTLIPAVTDGVPSKDFVDELEDKLNGHSDGKTVVSNSVNHASLDEKAVGDLEGEMTVATVDATEVKADVSAVDAPVDKPSAPEDENLGNSTVPVSNAAEEVAAATVDEQMVDMESSAGKSQEQSGVPSEDTPKVEDGRSKTKDSIKKRGRGKGKATLLKLAAQAAAENKKKEATTSQKSASKPMKDDEESKETPNTSRKRNRSEEENNESKEYGEELVGSGIKVWWPKDKKFYKGVIESFDSVKKRHKVLYADGEIENLSLKKQRWKVINPDEDPDMEDEAEQKTPDASSDKRKKGKEVTESTSKKRLGRPPSGKSKSSSSKPGRKPKDHDKNDNQSGDDSKAGAKTKTDGSKDEGKSKVASGKKVGRPKADASKSTTDEPSSNVTGKSKAEEPKPTDKSTAEAKSSGKRKPKSGKKGKSDSKTASKPESETSSAKQKDSKGKGTKEDTPKAASAAKNKGNSAKTPEKEDAAKTPEKEDADPSDSEKTLTGDAAEEETPSAAKTAGGSKRKAPLSEKGNKSGAKSGRKKGRKQ